MSNNRYPNHHYGKPGQIIWNWLEVEGVRIPLETVRLDADTVHMVMDISPDEFPESMYALAEITFKGITRKDWLNENLRKTADIFDYESMECLRDIRIVSKFAPDSTIKVQWHDTEANKTALQTKFEEDMAEVFVNDTWHDALDDEDRMDAVAAGHDDGMGYL
jgi:hypothetical protein